MLPAFSRNSPSRSRCSQANAPPAPNRQPRRRRRCPADTFGWILTHVLHQLVGRAAPASCGQHGDVDILREALHYAIALRQAGPALKDEGSAEVANQNPSVGACGEHAGSETGGFRGFGRSLVVSHGQTKNGP